MIRVIALFCALIIPTNAFAQSAPKIEDGYVKVSERLRFYIRHQKATADHGTLVILSGLTHETVQWNSFLRDFHPNKTGILQIDMAGQGKTLSVHGPVTDVIKYQDQVANVAAVLKTLGLTSKISVLGLSYGGGIATMLAARYPQMIERAILLAPYHEPQPEQDKWIKDQVKAARATWPYNPASDDELYDYYLRQLVYSVYPAAEPELLTVPFKLEAVFRMAQGIRKLHTAPFAPLLPARSVHLVVGTEDTLVKPDRLERFWNSIPQSKRSSRLFLKGTEHNIIQLQPEMAARWVELILANDPRTLNGQTHAVDPRTGVITKQ